MLLSNRKFDLLTHTIDLFNSGLFNESLKLCIHYAIQHNIGDNIYVYDKLQNA